MDYNRIVAVTGLPGLYEAISSKADGAVVRSLEDQSTKFVSARIHNLSHLESIEVYTTGENVGLADVFLAMKKSEIQLPDAKDNKTVKKYFESVYPDLDFERVYASDMKKMIKWYEILEKNNVDYTPKTEGEHEAVEEVVAEAAPVEEEPVEKKTKTKAKASAETKKEASATEEKPKKTARKKKSEE